MKDKFETIYKLFRLHLYQQVFKTLNKNYTDLSTSEYLCLESIYLLNEPTVSKFAQYLGISSSNAAYKVRQLIKKGYTEKKNSPTDARVYSLVPTDKFYSFYKDNNNFIYYIFKQIETILDKEELDKLNTIFDKIINKYTK